MSYPYTALEKKWQSYWEEQATFKTPDDRQRPPCYILDMFPYPSGEGLHVGHPEGYTATDIVARARRMQGFNVLHPMGWDAFGLPAERHAMKTGIHPAQTTAQNINNFRRQLKSLGFSYDWEREINTTDPDYYRWTQWIFLKIYNSYYDVEEKRARPISELQVPAEVEGDASQRQAYIDNQRLAYIAETPVNWCAELGTVLANEEVSEWVEKGYSVERRPMRQWMLRITAYAERLLEDLKYVDWPAGTLELQKNWIGRSHGALVKFQLADGDGKAGAGDLEIFTTRPDTLYGVTYMVLAPEHPLVIEITTTDQKAAVEKYIKATAQKSELERQVESEKGEKSGVFTGGHAIHPLTGKQIPIWIADYVLMGYGTGAIMAVPAHDERDYEFARTFELPIKHVVKPLDSKDDKWREAAYPGQGENFDSPLIDGLKTKDAIKKMIAHLEAERLGQGQINYRLRDWLFSRQRYWGEPIPISFAESGEMVDAAEDTLPLKLPPSDNFQPADTGESPLANLTDWVNYEADGKKLRRETNTMPQWAGSCWYYLRFISPDYADGPVEPDAERYWMGDDGVGLYIGGAEHAVLHLLYARFWHKLLYDLGYVQSIEPFKKLVHQGLILGEDNRKMSKSLGNVVNPDLVVEQFGADALRLYEMFLGPLEQKKPWSMKGIEGVYRFLTRAFRLYTGAAEETTELSGLKIDPELLKEPSADDAKRVNRILHQTIIKVTNDIDKLSFNTAISQLMIFVNEFFADKSIGREASEKFVLLLSPFAPHLAEELWQLLGHQTTLAYEEWPGGDPSQAAEDEIEVVFQVNGKVRGKVKLPVGLSDDELKTAALSNETVAKHLDRKEPRRVIVVKGKLVNVVI